ncbi:hypothetical protein [Candidatus Halobonum tyrrellensis]|uniref:CARDB domain-containing protein n=1 Tax=Candidatus Halobonum tyrrellensis G22 TaxID=1324957 RepID=V4GSE9_9EURY|nr:hypothetical protein [Candidatus Halobonum tyrrellensis]ESP88021.1 hypothetical protein K933_11201 [Candidatus Halobonum tyrrellensis G22]
MSGSPRRGAGAVLLAVVLLASVATVAVTVGAVQTDVAIRSVNASVDQPAPGEPFTLSVDVANLESSAGTVEVTNVFVRGADGTEYARAKNLGSVAAGSSLTVPVTATIDDAGRERLTVYAVVQDSAGDYTRVSYPLFVDVEEPDEAVVSFADLDPVAGEESGVNVTVSNGDAGALSNVRLELGGDADVTNPERVNASLAAGRQVTYTYDVTFPETGEGTLDATLTYKTDQGSTRTVTREVTTDVEAADVDAELSAAASTINGSPTVRAALTEYGNVELRDVRVSAVVDGETVARTLVGDVPEEGTRTATLDGNDIPAGEVTVRAEYTAAGDRQSTETTLDYSPSETANVTLTGVEVSGFGSSLSLSGDVANLGTADADSVLLSVPNRDGVSPTSPNGEYFVGTIESSEFATFELSASTSANATNVDSLPVRISYTADGERLSRVVSVDVSGGAAVAGAGAGGPGESGAAAGPAAASGSEGSGGSGGLPLLPIGVVLVVVAVVGFGVYRWRSQ